MKVLYITNRDKIRGGQERYIQEHMNKHDYGDSIVVVNTAHIPDNTDEFDIISIDESIDIDLGSVKTDIPIRYISNEISSDLTIGCTLEFLDKLELLD